MTEEEAIQEINRAQQVQRETIEKSIKAFEILPETEKLKTLLTFTMSLQFSTVENSAIISAMVKTMTDFYPDFPSRLVKNLELINNNIEKEIGVKDAGL